MTKISIIKTALSIAFMSTLLFGCKEGGESSEISFVADNDSIATWLLTDKITAFSEDISTVAVIEKTGLTKEDYLKVINAQVQVMKDYQNEAGGIVDPIRGNEVYYTTPCYAHSVAILISSGYTEDKELIESGMKALDKSCKHLKEQWAPGNHGDFFTWPVLFAYRQLKSYADSTRLDYWTKSIAGVKPEKFYAFHRNYSMNWNLVHAAGEFLRHKEGHVDINYIDTCLQHQKGHLTPEGMYNEWGNPLAYDLFSRHYLVGMLALGYKGEHFDFYRENMTKGAWMSMYMQSPSGELPTGYRSAHHIWNEAEQAMLFEIFATQYAQKGDKEVASAFKRAAMLSLQNIKGWIRPDGTGYAVKNKFPIEARHGYESYTAHSTYNMLAMSMLAQAYEFAADVQEGIAPADMGGYVLPIKPFHKIIASLNGAYLEYDTKGDQKYNPTGILRIHLKGTSPQLGPSDGIAAMWNSEGTSIALGPQWQNEDGSWTSLAQQKIEPTDFKILEESKKRVAFQVRYDMSEGVSVVETISIEDNTVKVKSELVGISGVKKLTWPLLVFDGKDKTKVSQSENAISLEAGTNSIQLSVLGETKTEITIPETEYNHRNGIAKVAEFTFAGKEIEYVIRVN